MFNQHLLYCHWESFTVKCAFLRHLTELFFCFSSGAGLEDALEVAELSFTTLDIPRHVFFFGWGSRGSLLHCFLRCNNICRGLLFVQCRYLFIFDPKMFCTTNSPPVMFCFCSHQTSGSKICFPCFCAFVFGHRCHMHICATTKLHSLNHCSNTGVNRKHKTKEQSSNCADTKGQHRS